MSEVSHSDLDTVEFTLDWYREFLYHLKLRYRFRSFAADPHRGDILLRHDVDLSVDAALETARIEADLGINATYMFLLTSPLYNPFQADTRETINEIAALGHDICLHFSTHEYWAKSEPPSAQLLVERVVKHRNALDSMLNAAVGRTVSFHIPPKWVLDRRFDDFQNTYAPELFSAIGYCADSGQRWRDEPPDIDAFPATVQLLTHPGLWRTDDGSFEHRIEQAIDDATAETDRLATREFIQDVYS